MPTVTQVPELPKHSTELKQPSTSVNSGAPVEAGVETKPAEKALSPQYVALARKEKALRNQAQALKAREDAMKAKEADYETSYIPKAKLSEQLKTNPMGFMQEHGLTYDQLAQLILNQPSAQDQALQKLQGEIEAVKQAQQQTLTQIEDQQKKAYEQAVTQIRTQAKLLIASDPNFETIKETGSEEVVVELIKETFNQDGILLDTEEAAKQVEEELIEEALKYAKLKKVQAKLSPPTVAEALNQQMTEKKPKIVAQEKPNQMKTITHSMTATTSPSRTDKERRERAILAARGML